MFRVLDKLGSIECMIKTIEDNNRQAQEIIEELNRYEATKKEFQEIKLLEIAPKNIAPKNPEKKKEIDITTYIDDYRKKINKEDLLKKFERKDSNKCLFIIHRLIAESLKDIKEITDIKIKDKEITSEEKEELTELIKEEKKKIEILKEIKEIILKKEIEEEVEEQTEKENKIILAPNENGNIFILEDLKKIPPEFYEEVKGLIDSIINGRFKRMKKFGRGTNAKIGGNSEVRGTKIRIVFRRLNADTYVLFYLFLKKTQKNQGYRDALQNRINEFKKVEEKIRVNLENEEFIKINDLYIQELYNKLKKQAAPKKYIKEKEDSK